MAEADREWLKQQLAAALGWDPAVAEGIVQAIATAESQDEVEELVQVLASELSPSSTTTVPADSSLKSSLFLQDFACTTGRTAWHASRSNPMQSN